MPILRKRDGFSLIEVMVSLVILVIGLIGIFNLHIISKQGSFESFQQTQASYYANDMINRMRLNKSQLAEYAKGSPYSGTPGAVGQTCDAILLPCSPNQMAKWDIFEWQSSFIGTSEVIGTQHVGGLDSATGCIKVNGNIVTVTMSWKSIRSSSDSGDENACGTASDKRRIYSIQTVII
ncbi:type IV pilus modification protein PilV [Shewanella sp. A14]